MDYPNYDPTALYAGEGPYRSRPVSIAQKAGANPNVPSSGVYARGTLLGRSSIASGPGAATAAAVAGNTGNGTVTPDAQTPVLAKGKAGAYVVKFTAANAFDVYTPDGTKLSSGQIGAAYADQIKFASAAGATAFVAGDSFTVTVNAADVYVPCVATATDGSQIPAAITATHVDTTAGATTGPAYYEGTFAFEQLTVDPSWSYATLRAAFRQNQSQLDVRSVGQLG